MKIRNVQITSAGIKFCFRSGVWPLPVKEAYDAPVPFRRLARGYLSPFAIVSRILASRSPPIFGPWSHLCRVVEQTFIEQQIGDVIVGGRGQLNAERTGRVGRVQRPGQWLVVVNMSSQTGHVSSQTGQVNQRLIHAVAYCQCRVSAGLRHTTQLRAPAVTWPVYTSTSERPCSTRSIPLTSGNSISTAIPS